MKLTEWDKCVLYLAENGGWVRALEMKGKSFNRGFIGSEADRRMQQVMKDQERDGFYEVEGIRYVIEAGKEGKFKTYRIASSTPKPVHKFVSVVLPDGTRAVREVVEAPTSPNLPPRSEECVLVGLSSVKDEYGACTGELREVWG